MEIEAGDGSPAYRQRRAFMLRDVYRFFETADGGFLLIRFEDFMELFPEGYSIYLHPGVLEDLALLDKSGTKWSFIDEEDQFLTFIKVLADSEKISRRKIKERITRHHLSSVAELMAFILESKDPNSLEEIEQLAFQEIAIAFGKNYKPFQMLGC
jgi:hypothetical protein